MSKVKILTAAVILAALGAGLLPASPADAGFDLLKGRYSSTVYYLDANNIRHTFPDAKVFYSWYGNAGVVPTVVGDDVLAKYPLGRNVTMRPGTYLVKVPSSPKVYAVERGGRLRPITDESIAEQIYGLDWSKRVVDVPEVFFANYEIGEPLASSDYLPDGALAYDPAKKTYYYKFGDLFQPFRTADDARANYFRLQDAVVMNRNFYRRERPITGLDQKVFSPGEAPPVITSDCENKDLKAAVILLSDKAYTAEQVAAVTKIKDAIPGRFADVTYGLSSIDTSYPLVLLNDDGYLVRKRNDGAGQVMGEVINTFYDRNEDIFDFIFVFTNFQTPVEADSNEIASFWPMDNHQWGIGRDFIEAGELYGSAGKLKGMILMGNIAKYDLADGAGFNGTINYAMHEILHNWAAYIYFDDGAQLSDKLLRPGDRKHWSYYAGFISPLGGSGWIDNGDGTFTNGLSLLGPDDYRRYSMLDLYLMGLIPAPLMEPVMYLEPDVPGATGNTIKGTAHYVSIEDIIRANGKIRCDVK